MTFTARTASDQVTIDAISARDDTMLQTIDAMRVRDTNNVSRVVYSIASPLSLSISPELVTGSSFGTGTATTDLATATPSGGVGPYTYAWTLVTHTTPPAALPTADSPTSSSTQFTQTGLTPNAETISTWRCTVTDDNGATAQDTCQAFFQDFS